MPDLDGVWAHPAGAGTAVMTKRDEGFAARWSRLKRDSGDEPATPEVDPAAAAKVPSPGDGAAGDDSTLPAEVVEELPDIETLEETSDFTVFLKDGVPEELRRRALRRLWRLNPVFANLDGLNDYDEDFTDAANVLGAVKTLYQAGKGYVEPEAHDDLKADEQVSGTTTAEPAARSSSGCSPEAAAPDVPQTGEAGPTDATAPGEDVEPDTAEAEASSPDAEVRRESGVSATERRWGRFRS